MNNSLGHIFCHPFIVLLDIVVLVQTLHTETVDQTQGDSFLNDIGIYIVMEPRSTRDIEILFKDDIAWLRSLAV